MDLMIISSMAWALRARLLISQILICWSFLMCWKHTVISYWRMVSRYLLLVACSASCMMPGVSSLIASKPKCCNPAFHGKPKMLPATEVEDRTGHAVGGVCPFALKDGVKVYLDVSMKRFGTVFPACGSSNSAIELSPEKLERLSGAAGWVDVCK